MAVMSSDKQVIKGNNNTQIINKVGSLFVMPGTRHPLTHSLIYELLVIVYESPLLDKESYSLELPVPMKEKLVYNKAPKYRNLFANHSEDFALVGSIMKDFPDSETIIKKLRDMFLDAANYDDNQNLVVGNGDEQLDTMKNQLSELIQNDAKYDSERHRTEEVEQFCIALLACGVDSCNVLVRPD